MKHLLSLCALVGIGLVSCSASLAKDDVLNYTGRIVNAVSLQGEAVEAYQSGFGENYWDDETSLGIVNDEAVPKFQALVLLKPSSDKVDTAQQKMNDDNTQFLALCKKFDIPVAQ